MITPFCHGFDNGVHMTRATTADDCYVVVTYVREAVSVRSPVTKVRVPAVRYSVTIRLYGQAWSEKDIERADRNSRFLPEDADLAQAREVALGCLRAAESYLSLRLRPLA